MSAKQVKAKTATAPEAMQKAASAKKAAGKKAVSRATSGSLDAGAKAAPRKQAPVQAATPAELSHRLHLLLHTIHQIERYEERLCSMQDAIKRTGKVSAPMLRDLHALLEEIPSDDYQHDLDAVRSVLPA